MATTIKSLSCRAAGPWLTFRVAAIHYDRNPGGGLRFPEELIEDFPAHVGPAVSVIIRTLVSSIQKISIARVS